MLWKILLFAIAGYALYRFFMNDRQRKNQTEEKQKETLIASGEMVKDPMCGAYIDAESSITVRNGATVHRFCSYECRDEYIKQLQSGQNELDK